MDINQESDEVAIIVSEKKSRTAGKRQRVQSDNELRNYFNERYGQGSTDQRRLKFLSIRIFAIDWLLVIISLLGLTYLKRGSFAFTSQNISFWSLFTGIWLFASLFFNKFDQLAHKNYKDSFIIILKSSIAMLFLLAIIFVFTSFSQFSRKQTLGTCGAFFLLESLVFLLYYFLGSEREIRDRPAVKSISHSTAKYSLLITVSDFLLFVSSFFMLNYFKSQTLVLSIEGRNLLWIFLALWFFVGLFTRKFEIHHYRNIYYAVSPFLKSSLIIFSSLAILIYSFNLFFYSRAQVFGTLILFFGAEAFFIFLYYLDWHQIKNSVHVHSTSAPPLAEELSEILASSKEKNYSIIESLSSILQNEEVANNVSLLDFMINHIVLRSIARHNTKIINTDTFDKIGSLSNRTYNLFINLHRLNDIRYLNEYFLLVQKKVHRHGYFVGHLQTIQTYQKQFFQKYPGFIAKLIYPLDFIYRRIVPKLPVFKKGYFFLTKGKNRIISKAEALGRLYYCGFKIIAVKEIGATLYFIAQNEKKPCTDTNPSYGLFIKLNRIGLNGEKFYLRKFRTMHPYSEFLQDYIGEQNKLRSNGKFLDDFRITGWGKWMRKFWIDELLQFINFFQGDISLVGVRALSEHYFSLYPKDLQRLRIKFKPGLVPPYYADMPKCFDDIIASERKYLKQKMQRPWRTDIKYFAKAMYNILFKAARSL